MSFESMIPSHHLILCHLLLLLPSIFSSIRVFSSDSGLHIRWPKYWSFSFSISPSNECWGLISFTIDWFYLLVVQGMLKSLLQHHSSKASIQYSTSFMVQLSHLYMTTGKTMLWLYGLLSANNVSAFYMLSRFVIAFLPRSKHLNFMAAVTVHSDFGAPRNKVCHCFHFFSIYLPWSDGIGCHGLSFLNVEF